MIAVPLFPAAQIAANLCVSSYSLIMLPIPVYGVIPIPVPPLATHSRRRLGFPVFLTLVALPRTSRRPDEAVMEGLTFYLAIVQPRCLRSRGEPQPPRGLNARMARRRGEEARAAALPSALKRGACFAMAATARELAIDNDNTGALHHCEALHEPGIMCSC